MYTDTMFSDVRSIINEFIIDCNIVNKTPLTFDSELSSRIIGYLEKYIEKRYDTLTYDQLVYELRKIKSILNGMEKYKLQEYDSIGHFKIDEVLPFITVNPSKKEYMGHMVKMHSLRYHTFAKSLTCVSCGAVGEYFSLETPKNGKDGKKYHFNLYGYNKDGEIVLFTKDHIIPKSRGGDDCLDNFQTMCHKCNFKKKDRL